MGEKDNRVAETQRKVKKRETCEKEHGGEKSGDRNRAQKRAEKPI